MGEQEVVINQDKPDGTLQKLLDISKIKNLGWKPNIALKDGIRNVYEWYVTNKTKDPVKNKSFNYSIS